MDESGRPLAPLEIPAVRRAVGILFGLAVFHGALAAATYESLPPRIPLHFDASGAPDAFGGPTPCAWFGPWLVSTLLGAAICAIGVSIHRIPASLLSLPRKREFMALPEWRRARVAGVLSLHTLVLAALVMGIFLAIQSILALAAHGLLERFQTHVVWLGACLVTGEIAVSMIHVSSVVSREIALESGERRRVGETKGGTKGLPSADEGNNIHEGPDAPTDEKER